MKELKIYVGNIDKKVVNEVLGAISQTAGGVTLTTGTGYWIDPETSKLYAENSNIFITLCENDQVANQVKNVVNTIMKTKTSELSVLITERELSAEFVELR